MRTVAPVLLAAAVAVCCSSICWGDDEEMKRLQGRYERTVTNRAGVAFRVVKDIANNQSTVTTYDDVGRVVEAHTSTFKVEKRGDVRVLSYFNVAVTAGAEKGREDPTVRSYIYRFEGDNFAEAWGLLVGDESPPRMFFWKKVKAE